MLINEWAIFLNLLSIALMGLLAATILLTLLSPRLLHYIPHLTASTQKKALWLLVSTPGIVGILCVLLFIPSLIQSGNWHWLDQIAHWHHPYVFYLDSWHAVLLSVFTIGTLYMLIHKAANASRHLRTLKTLTCLTQNKDILKAGKDVVVLQSQSPSAFTAGLLKPRCYITTGLIDEVSKAELDIIIDHERAHIRHNDAQKKWLFTLLASIYPKRVTRTLTKQFSLATELLADAQVSKSYNGIDIAHTLVKTARIQRSFTGRATFASVSHFIAGDVEFRVKALIAPPMYRSFPWSYSLLLFGLTVVASTLGVDALHHLVEAVFSH